MFVGSSGGKVYSLSAATGCVHWFFDAGRRRARGDQHRPRSDAPAARVRRVLRRCAPPTSTRSMPATGTLLWKTRVDDFPVARITGSPMLHNGRLYVPVASGEEGAGAVADVRVLPFRGSVVALDAATGKQVWKTYTIAEEPKPTKKNAVGTQLWGPSGAPIWTQPGHRRQAQRAVRHHRQQLQRSAVAHERRVRRDRSRQSGKILWSRQMTAPTPTPSACRLPDKTNCAESNGPDFDFSASPILVTLPNGRRRAASPARSPASSTRSIRTSRARSSWQTRVGQGGTMGGVQWGSAADETNVYVALSDIGRIMLTYSTVTDADPEARRRHVRAAPRRRRAVWYTPPPGCGDAHALQPGAVGRGQRHSRRRVLRIGRRPHARLLHDRRQDPVGLRHHPPVRDRQRRAGRGGSLDGPGPAIAGGMLFVNSGYRTAGGMPGNVLLAFSVDGK